MISEAGSTGNAFFQDCCGKKICRPCYMELLNGPTADICPMCRSDNSDRSEAAHVRKLTARALQGDASPPQIITPPAPLFLAPESGFEMRFAPAPSVLAKPSNMVQTFSARKTFLESE